MIFQIRQTIDIKKDNHVFEYKQGLDYGNNLAHEWLVFVEEDGALVDLASVAVTGYFLREDGVTVKVDGSVKNGACSVVFDRRCYLIEGAVKCAMVLTRGAEVVTAAKLRTNANQSITDQIIDTGDTIPTDIYDLLTQIDAMREATTATVAATAAANAAAERANAGAQRAEQLQIDASGLAGDSNKLGGKPPEYYLPAVNLFLNSDWREGYFIAQAGINGLLGSVTYLGDGWKNESSISASIYANGITIESDSQYKRIQQTVKNLIPGKPYTVALKSTGNVLRRVAVLDTKLSRLDAEVVGRDDLLIVTFTAVDSTHAFLFYPGYEEGGGSSRFEWPMLLPGTYNADTLPPFVPPDPVAELLKCQRYLLPLPRTTALYGYSSTGANLYLHVPTPVQMAGVPSIAGTLAVLTQLAGKSESITTFDVHSVLPNEIRLSCPHGSYTNTITNQPISGYVDTNDVYICIDL